MIIKKDEIINLLITDTPVMGLIGSSRVLKEVENQLNKYPVYKTLAQLQNSIQNNLFDINLEIHYVMYHLDVYVTDIK